MCCGFCWALWGPIWGLGVKGRGALGGGVGLLGFRKNLDFFVISPSPAIYSCNLQQL